MISAETQARIAELRQLDQAGKLTIEEMKEVVILLRGDRFAAQTASDSSKRKQAKAEIPSADDMLDELTKI